MDTRLLSAKPGLSVSPATLGGGQVSLDRGSLEVKLTEGLEPQEKEINAEFPLPPVNLGKDRATLGSCSGIHPRDLRVDQEQVQDPSSPAEHCGDPHCGDRLSGCPHNISHHSTPCPSSSIPVRPLLRALSLFGMPFS